MRQYEMCELCFSGELPEENQAQAEIAAVFANGNESVKVSGFYAGEGVYKVRFLPMTAGNWHYQVNGAVSAEGELDIEEAKSHGPVRTDGCAFRYADGTLYWPFGTTVYALAHQEDSLVKQTLDTLAGSPFNKVRMCLFPKHYDYNHNEPPFYAFEKDAEGKWDVTRPCTAFWDRMEEIIRKLDEMDIQVDLILFHPYDRWGFAALSQKENLIYLDYLLRRFAAFPNIWWSLANEYDLCSYKTTEDFEEFEEFIAAHDPYHHLIGNHNCFAFWDHTRPNITHASLQTKMLYRIAEWRKKYKKPVMVDECCYEGNIEHPWGSISGKEMTNRFWRVVTTGGFCTHGETFLDPDDILWWARGGVLHGESPERIAFLRKIVEELPGPIEPKPSHMGAVYEMANADPKTQEKRLEETPKEFRFFAGAFLKLGDELALYAAGEPTYEGHCGEDAYLTFFDLRTCAKSTLELPEEHTYRVELIDTWNMTRTVLLSETHGKTELNLPGREGMAVLAVRIA